MHVWLISRTSSSEEDKGPPCLVSLLASESEGRPASADPSSESKNLPRHSTYYPFKRPKGQEDLLRAIRPRFKLSSSAVSGLSRQTVLSMECLHLPFWATLPTRTPVIGVAEQTSWQSNGLARSFLLASCSYLDLNSSNAYIPRGMMPNHSSTSPSTCHASDVAEVPRLLAPDPGRS